MPYQWKQVNEEIGMFSKDVEGLTTNVNKMLELVALSITIVDNIRHVRGQHKLYSVSRTIKAIGDMSILKIPCDLIAEAQLLSKTFIL